MSDAEDKNIIISDTAGYGLADYYDQIGEIQYINRLMISATLPYNENDETLIERISGNISFSLAAPPSLGLPFGNVPRLVIVWLCTEALKRQSRHLELGCLGQFMSDLGMTQTGGRWGTLPRMKNQMIRLASTQLMVYQGDGDDSEGSHTAVNYSLAENAHLWWDNKRPDQESLFPSVWVLTENFYDDVLRHPIPLRMEVLRALKKSSLALDVYQWLTYRMATLSRPTAIHWPGLKYQFGSNYADTQRGMENFKAKFRKAVKQVLAVYPEANISELKGSKGESKGIMLKRGRPSVPRRLARRAEMLPKIDDKGVD